ncbi:methyltransferase domain-containing protein [Streptacidiphilus fuscans]|uniref:Methyltransferase domain-containing protein n=1 Tax=Streptacidiphilus fuscans TaxID=2789292 RepID=A0A931BDZ9_9ACTN|nr:methyltransferase domain-containing protein [Streptacidiphilus fuscans]MBF9067808.1 methyltransferase domain-containing protein [Streptacidiphilus fuscans]MBF9073891.1 methyltransferase domain-containing protein [Streptacidiphilus fuscans]
MNAVSWDPKQYLRHADLRSRPFFELVDRVPTTPRRVVDLGCGPGNVTISLTERWPDATLVGVDSSPAMIEQAQRDFPERAAFRVGDIATYDPAEDQPDLILSNAALQWVPGHLTFFPGWIEALPQGGVLAFQVPGNFDQPSHALLTELRNSPCWRDTVGGPHRAAIPEPAQYLATLSALGCVADVWETTYHQVLQGEQPILDWMLGTGLRPTLDLLPDPQQREAFLAEYAALLDAAYPRQDFGTVLPFRRVFAVAVKM